MLYRPRSLRARQIAACWALLLAVIWVPSTSHQLLESAGWIHQNSAGTDDDGPAHDAADGNFQAHGNEIRPAKPALISLGWLVDSTGIFAVTLFLAAGVAWYLRRETASPPGWLRPWQFVVRAALPGRAPCCLD